MVLKKVLVASAASVLFALSLGGCAQNPANKGAEANKAKTEQAQPAADKQAPAEDEGAVALNKRPDKFANHEQDGPETSVGPFDLALHFFQPGHMADNQDATMKMVDYKDAQMHLELDTKANKFGTNWGYSVDETPADLRMVYSLADASGKVLSQGMMMEMNAIDGSHYGTNLKNDTIPGPGDYKLTITVYPPQNYALHNDYKTGVIAKSWFKPLTTTMDWKITQEQFDMVKKDKIADPLAVPEGAPEVKMYKDKAAEAAMAKAEAAKPLPLPEHHHH